MAKTTREKKIDEANSFFDGKLSESQYHQRVDAAESKSRETPSFKINIPTPKINIRSSGGGGSKRDFFKEGFSEYLGRAKALSRLHRNPIGAVIFLALVYAFFSIGPIRIFPAVSLMAYLWAGTALFALLTGNLAWIFVWIVVFIIFNLAIVMNIFSFGDFYSQEFQEKFNIGSIQPVTWIKQQIFASYGDWKNPKKSEEVEKKGITFKYFKPDDDYFAEGERVSLSADVVVDGLYDADAQTYQPFPLSFSCYEQQLDGSIGREGKIYVDDSQEQLTTPITVPAQAKVTYTILCLFEQGLAINLTAVRTSILNPNITSEIGLSGLSKTQIAEGVTIDNKLITKKIIVLEAKIKFSQVGSLKMYAVSDATKPERLSDIISDPDLLKDGHVRPRCISGCGGPYLLSVSTGVQPITELKQPKLQVELLRDPGALGHLSRLDSIIIALPEDITLTSTPAFPCDFTGFSARQEKIDQINNKLQTLLAARLKGGEEQQDPAMRFQCFYTVNRPPDQPTAKLIQVRAIYDVLMQKRTLVEISRDLEAFPTQKPTT